MLAKSMYLYTENAIRKSYKYLLFVLNMFREPTVLKSFLMSQDFLMSQGKLGNYCIACVPEDVQQFSGSKVGTLQEDALEPGYFGECRWFRTVFFPPPHWYVLTL